MNIEIRRANGQADEQGVHTLREQAFMVEQGLAYDRLEAEVDRHSTVLIAEHEGEVVASLRITRRSDGPLEDEHALMLPLWRKAFADAELFQVSRFVIEAARRGSALQLHLLTAAYEFIRAAGGRVCFLDCAPALVRYYQRIGFRRFAPAYVHATLGGEYTPLVMFIDDAPYFRRTHALLGRMAKVDGAQRARALFERHVDPEYLFVDAVVGACDRPFAHYSSNEALREQARHFEVCRLAPGERVVVRRRLVVVRSGSIRVDRDGASVILETGQHIGEAQVLARLGTSLEVEAIKAAELMLLTPEQFVEQTTRFAGLALALLIQARRVVPQGRSGYHTPPASPASEW